MTGLLLSFLPSTRARVLVSVPLPIPNEWWSYTIMPNAPGVVLQERVEGFLITVFDFRLPVNTMNDME